MFSSLAAKTETASHSEPAENGAARTVATVSTETSPAVTVVTNAGSNNFLPPRVGGRPVENGEFKLKIENAEM